jgi:NADH-quinone oxidoreductase subunit M
MEVDRAVWSAIVPVASGAVRVRSPVPWSATIESCQASHAVRHCGLAKLLPVYSVFFMILTLASVGLPTTSGFTGEFLVLLGAFTAAWPLYQGGDSLPLVLAVVAVSGIVLGALYMLRFALTFLYGAPRAPHHSDQHPLADLSGREKTILGLIVVAVFAIGLFPDEPMRKTELAAQAYRQLVSTPRLPGGTP